MRLVPPDFRDVYLPEVDKSLDEQERSLKKGSGLKLVVNEGARSHRNVRRIIVNLFVTRPP